MLAQIQPSKWRNLLSPKIIILILSLVIAVVSLYTAYQTRPFVSDDISWQNILQTWTPTNGHQVYMGAKDNFILNVPLLALLGHFFSPSRTLIFVEAAIFAVINFSLFYFANLYFLKKCKVRLSYLNLSPFLWLASLGYEFSQSFLNTAWRNFEPGVSFIFFMLAYKLYAQEFGEIRSVKSKIWLGLAGLVAGIFAFNDPYFLYFTVAPILAFFMLASVFRRLRKRTLVLAVSTVVLSLAAMLVLKHVVSLMGLLIPASDGYAHFGHWIEGLTGAFKNIAIIFSASPERFHSLDLSSAAAGLNLVLVLGTILGIIYGLLVRVKRTVADAAKHRRRLLFCFSGIGVLIFAANVVIDPFTYRYFLLFVYLLILASALLLGQLKARWRVAAVALISISVIMNLVVSLFIIVPAQHKDGDPNPVNESNYKIIGLVESLGLTKGYANYWNGNINSYLSSGKVEFLPVYCKDDTTTKRQHFLMDSDLFARPAAKSFYMMDPDETYPSACPEKALVAQFGPPESVAHFRNKTFLIFDYDIAARMSPSQTK